MAPPITRKAKKYTRAATPTDPKDLPGHVRAELEKIQQAQPNSDVTVVTANYAVQPGDRTLLVDATAGPLTITLGDAGKRIILPITIVKVSAGANVVTIAAQPGDTINGAASVTLVTQYTGYTLVPDGLTKWIVQGTAGSAGASVPQWTLDDAQTPPSAPSALNDEFNGAVGTAISASWTTVHLVAGTTALLDGKGRLVVRQTVTGGGFTLWVKAAPATPWRITTRIYYMGDSGTSLGGLVVRNSATSKFITMGPEMNGGALKLLIARWTNEVTFSLALLESALLNYVIPGLYYRITSDGTTLSFQISYAGLEDDDWQTIKTETLAAFVGAVDTIGLAVNSGGIPAHLLFEFFRVS